ncbi:peptidase family M48-domain-containing protein, partial [Cantharellus anzutake]
ILVWGLTYEVGIQVVYFVYHLERVPETGRLRFIDVSVDSERQAGEETFQQIIHQYKGHILPSHHPLTKYVVNVAERILEATSLGHVKGHNTLSSSTDLVDDVWRPDGDRLSSPVSNDEWEVYVIDDDTRNAFVLPGGKIFVFTGILPSCKNEDGLASVLGHEIAHQVARHSGERMSSTKVIFFLVTLLELLGLDVGVSRIGLTLLLTLPNSRTQEAEADSIGLKLMSKACFDPAEATRQDFHPYS